MTEIQLAWSEDGTPDGSPVLMGSSLGTTREMWRPGLEALSDMRVIRFDHLGHGESQVPDGPYTVQQLGEAVIELMDHLGIDCASYVGLSLGGAVGQWLAVNQPRRIRRLALVATAAYFPTPESWRERAAQVRAEGPAIIAQGAMQRWFPAHFLQEQPDEVARWQQMIADTPAEGYAGCCEALSTFDMRDQLARISVRTIVIAGADDPSTTPETMRGLARGIPAAQLEIVEDAAHLVNVAQPQRTGELLSRCLLADR